MNQIGQIKELIEKSDAILIGAGAGLSTAAGFTYSGERFEKYFTDFINKYHFTDMYSGGFHSYSSLEEHWAYWSRYIFINRYLNVCDEHRNLYKQLIELVNKKNFFVLTTNVDHQFQKAGIDKKKLFYTQGDYGLLQCSVPCHKSTYDNVSYICKMMAAQIIGKEWKRYYLDGNYSNEQQKVTQIEKLLIENNNHFKSMEIPTELIPYCPKCGKPMTMNLRSDDTFVEDAGWNKASQNFDNFVINHYKERLLLIELGVGFNTPSIIKYPFWNMAIRYPQTTYICINKGCSTDGSLEEMPHNLRDTAICIDGDCALVIKELLL
jgi:NAD-dependent SIR2 family protein deacetylase